MEVSGTLNVLDYYAEHYRPGMIDLSASGPRFPEQLPEAGLDYAPPGGLSSLRAAIAGLYPGLDPEAIAVTNGASEALAAIAFAFLRPGDHFVASAGVYPSFREVASRLGARESGHASPVAPALVVINNPDVPSGRLPDPAPLLRATEARGGRVAADEVHLDLRLGSGGTPIVSLSQTAISIGDLSKPLGLGGLRIGWAACRDLGAIAKVNRAVQLLSGGPSVVAMEMATRFVAEYSQRLGIASETARANAPELFAALTDAGWTFEPPDAGWTFLATPPRPLTVKQRHLLRDAGFFLLPATTFGASQGYRLSLFAPADSLRDALRITREASTPTDECLVVLAKAPQPGFSKTRLAATFGDTGAAELSQAFLDDTLELAAASGRPALIAFTPVEARATFADRVPFAVLIAQPEGDLGERIRAGLDCALRYSRAAVLIGSDTPHLPAGVLDDAFESLAEADVVVGPACDGGFYLLGLATESVPGGLFEDIQWSTAGVCQRLLQNVRKLGLAVRLLDEQVDIDDAGSLEIAMHWPQGTATASRTRAAVERIRLEGGDGA